MPHVEGMVSTYAGVFASQDVDIVHAVYDLTSAHHQTRCDTAVCRAEGDAYPIHTMVTCLRCIAMMCSSGWWSANSSPEESRWLEVRSKTIAGL